MQNNITPIPRNTGGGIQSCVRILKLKLKLKIIRWSFRCKVIKTTIYSIQKKVI